MAARAFPGIVEAMAVIFVVISVLASGVFVAVQPATGIPFEVISLAQFGTAVAVLAVLLIRPARTREVMAGTFGGPVRAYESALPLTTVLIVGLTVGAYTLVYGSPDFTLPEHSLPVIVVAQFIGACAEEIGWRCFLQPLLRRRFGPLTTSVIVGAIWGLWHVQVFTKAPGVWISFLVATVSMSVILGLAFERARSRRLLLAGGFHMLINIGLLLLMNEESGAVLPNVLFGASCLVAALLWIRFAPVRIQPTPTPVIG